MIKKLFDYKLKNLHKIFSVLIIFSVILLGAYQIVASENISTSTSGSVSQISILSLNQGEMVPSSATVVFNNNGKILEYPLNQFISEAPADGSFYLEGKNLSGNGQGYGFIGERTIYPTVYFSLNFLSINLSENVSENVSNLGEGGNISVGDSEILEENLSEEVIPGQNVSIEETVVPEINVSVEENQTEQQVSSEEEVSGEEIPSEENAIVEESLVSETSVEETPVEEPSAPEPEISTEESSSPGASTSSEETSSSEEPSSSESSSSGEESSPPSVVVNVALALLRGISNFFLGLTMTGNVVSEGEQIIEGNVSFGNPFIYPLQENAIVEIKEGSVYVLNSEGNKKQIEDSFISLELKEGSVIASTNYSEIERGFGKDYSGSEQKIIYLNLSSLEGIFEEGNLSVSLVYENEELASLSGLIEQGQIVINETLLEEILPLNETSNMTLFTLETDKNLYSQNESINFSGGLIVGGERVSGEINLTLLFDNVSVYSFSALVANGSYESFLTADFMEEGEYVLRAKYDSLEAEAGFMYFFVIQRIGNASCKEFKEQVLWTSGYSNDELGSTNYQVWDPKYKCSVVNRSDCFLGPFELETRFFYFGENNQKGEGYVQISNSTLSSCANPENGIYSGHLAQEKFTGEAKKMGQYCGSEKESNKKCDLEVLNPGNYVGCYGIKSYASQYLIIDTFEIKYSLCWNE